jgi:hypothetical protein
MVSISVIGIIPTLSRKVFWALATPGEKLRQVARVRITTPLTKPFLL